jgi:hypothetical protein
MCCDDYPGAVVLTAPSNMRLKLTAPVVCGRIAFVSTSIRRRSLSANPLGRPVNLNSPL